MARIEVRSIGNNKIKIVKVIRELSGLSLKDTTDFVNNVESNGPGQFELQSGISLSEAITTLQMEGATVTSIENFDTNDFHAKVSENDHVVSLASSNDDNILVETVKTDNIETESTNTDVFVPFVDSSNINNLDRDGTMQLLIEIGKISKEEEILNSELQQSNIAKKEVLQEADRIRKSVSKGAKAIIWTVTIIAGFFGLILGPLCIVTALVAFIIMQCTVKKSDLKKHANENNLRAEEYLNSNLPSIQNRIDELQANIDSLVSSGRKRWAIDVIGNDMYYSGCVEDLYNLVKSRRADNLKEALNKYDDSQHKARMEEMQKAIQNASEITAAESVKQTEFAKAIEANTHKAATASMATAYHTRQIDKNTRRFR